MPETSKLKKKIYIDIFGYRIISYFYYIKHFNDKKINYYTSYNSVHNKTKHIYYNMTLLFGGLIQTESERIMVVLGRCWEDTQISGLSGFQDFRHITEDCQRIPLGGYILDLHNLEPDTTDTF